MVCRVNTSNLSIEALEVNVSRALRLCVALGFVGWAVPAAHAQSCLSQSGPLETISGPQTSRYNETSLAASTKIDARTASWYALGETPVKFGGGSGLCWSGGFTEGDYPLDASWHTTHPTASLWVNAQSVVIENFHGKTYGDGIKLYDGIESFVIRGVFLEDMRDDCVEGDWLPGGVIEDSLLNGCYVPFAFQFRDGDSADGRDRTVEIRNVLAWLRDQIGVYKGPVPGHSMFFKWPRGSDAARGLKISMHNTILRVDSDQSESPSEQFHIPDGKLVSCSNNIIVWGGSGAVPSELAAWPSCFTITTDMSVWNSAVATWKANHGYGGTGSPPPVVQNLRRTDLR